MGEGTHKAIIGSIFLLLIIIYAYFEHSSRLKYFTKYKTTTAKITEITTDRHSQSKFEYEVFGFRYEGRSSKTSKFRVGKKYHLLYSLEDPRYNIILWELEANKKLTSENISINELLKFMNGRVNKAKFLY